MIKKSWRLIVSKLLAAILVLLLGSLGLPGNASASTMGVGYLNIDKTEAKPYQTVTVTYSWPYDPDCQGSFNLYLIVEGPAKYHKGDPYIAAKNVDHELSNGYYKGSWTVQAPVQPGTYNFMLLGPVKWTSDGLFGSSWVEQDDEVDYTDFTVVSYDTKLTCPGSAQPGGKVTVSWQNASTHPYAWIGFYKKDAPDTQPLKKIDLKNLPGNRWEVDAPMTPGNYSFRIFQDDKYVRTGSQDIIIGYNTTTITVQPDEAHPGDTVTVAWSNGPPFDNSGHLDFYHGDQKFSTFIAGVDPEETVQVKLSSKMSGMYQVRMYANEDVLVGVSNSFAVIPTNSSNVQSGGGSGSGAASNVQPGGGSGSGAASNDNPGNNGIITIRPGITDIRGLSPGSGGLQLHTDPSLNLPSLPAGAPSLSLSATAGDGSVTLQWKEAADKNGLDGYYLYKGTSSGGENASPMFDFPINTLTYTDKKVTNDTTYYYIMKPSYDGGARSGAASNEASATPSANTAAGKGTIVFTIGSPKMTVNGKSQEIEPGTGTSPVINDGRTFVPIRAITETMGGTASWDGSTRKITIVLKDKTIELWIGKNSAMVNGETKTLDVAPYISDTNRTMLPLRFIIENLGCNVTWNGPERTITIDFTP